MVDQKLNPLGIVWMVWSAITGLAGLLVAAVAMGFGGLVTMLPDDTTGEPAPWWVGFLFGGVGITIGLVILGMGAFGMMVGSALRYGRRWALIAALILGFFQLSNMPVGTALGIWTFVVVIPALSAKPAT